MSKQSAEDIQKMVEDRVAQEESTLIEAGVNVDSKVYDARAALDTAAITKYFVAYELGDSELFSLLNKEKFACNDTSEKWMRFTGPHWEVDKMRKSALAAIEDVVDLYIKHLLVPVENELSEVDWDDKDAKKAAGPLLNKKKSIVATINRLRSRTGRNALLDCAATNANPLFLTPEQLDQNHLLFPCANGVYDLDEDVFREGKPSDYLTSCSPYEYKGLDEPCEKFEKYLFESTGENLDDYNCLRRHIGYMITGLNKERMFMVLHGPHGQNGKGTLFNILNRLLHTMCGSIPTEMLMQQKGGTKTGGPTPEVMDLKGKRVVFASETEDNQHFAHGLIKRWSGGDEASGRYMGKDEIVRFYTTHTLALLCNKLPKAPAWDDAFWARIRVFMFPYSYQPVDMCTESYHRPADRNLEKDILEEEMSGIISWLIQCYHMYRADGLKLSDNVKEWSKRYRESEDKIQDFLDSCCKVDFENLSKDNCTQASELFRRYRVWHEAGDVTRPMTQANFSEALELKGFKKFKNSCMFYRFVQIDLTKAKLED